MVIMFSGFLTSCNGEDIFTEAFNDTLYSVDAATHKLSLEYKLDFGSRNVGLLKNDHNRLLSRRQLFKNNLSYIGSDACINKDFLTFSYIQNNRRGFSILNRHTGKLIKVNKMLNDGLYKLLDRPVLLTTQDELFFAVSQTAVAHLKSDDKPLLPDLRKKWPKVYEELNNLTKNDNYFLLSLKLK
jgi:hypothetical protein